MNSIARRNFPSEAADNTKDVSDGEKNQVAGPPSNTDPSLEGNILVDTHGEYLISPGMSQKNRR